MRNAQALHIKSNISLPGALPAQLHGLSFLPQKFTELLKIFKVTGRCFYQLPLCGLDLVQFRNMAPLLLQLSSLHAKGIDHEQPEYSALFPPAV